MRSISKELSGSSFSVGFYVRVSVGEISGDWSESVEFPFTEKTACTPRSFVP
jgi:hypothetical protein